MAAVAGAGVGAVAGAVTMKTREEALTKRCSKCGEVKVRNAFSPCLRNRSGLRSACKACYKITSQTRYVAHRDRLLAEKKAYRVANLDKVTARYKRWAATHTEHLKAFRRTDEFRAKSRERSRKRRADPRFKADLLARNRAWRAANPEWVKSHNKQYQRTHRPRMNCLSKLSFKRACEALTDSYVKHTLCYHKHISATHEAICDPELIELKREFIQIKRRLRK